MDGKEFWARLKEALAQHGDNLNRLAKQTGISYNVLYQKSTFGKLLTDGQLQRIAGALGMTAGDLRRGNFGEYVSITQPEAEPDTRTDVETKDAATDADDDADDDNIHDVQAANVDIDTCYDGTERLWALEKVHFIIGTVTDTETAIKKLTALRKAIDVTIYFLEDK